LNSPATFIATSLFCCFIAGTTVQFRKLSRIALVVAASRSFAAAREPMERAAAKGRTESGRNQYSEPSGKLPEGSKGKSRDRRKTRSADVYAIGMCRHRGFA
jgi:hypothetical protein